MTMPLAILAVCAVLLGFLGTPAWPWFQAYLEGRSAHLAFDDLVSPGVLGVMLSSTVVVAIGIGVAWLLYGVRPASDASAPDPLEARRPGLFRALQDRLYFDELYDVSVIRMNAWCSRMADWLDRSIWNGVVQFASFLALGLAWLNRFIDEYVVNLGFDKGCTGLRQGGAFFSRLQAGQVQSYLRAIGIGLAVLVLLLTLGRRL